MYVNFTKTKNSNFLMYNYLSELFYLTFGYKFSENQTLVVGYFLEGKTLDSIPKINGFNCKRSQLKKITTSLLSWLSQTFDRAIDEKNFRQVVEQHYWQKVILLQGIQLIDDSTYLPQNLQTNCLEIKIV